MRGAVGLLLALAIGCETEDPRQLRAGSPLRRRTNNAPAVVATGSSEAEKCFKVVNEYRAKIGAPPLKRWTKGESCAADEAASDAKSNRGARLVRRLR